jgi:hypothetical protein
MKKYILLYRKWGLDDNSWKEKAEKELLKFVLSDDETYVRIVSDER